MADDHTPQWLKEVLKRGFKPSKIYHDFDNVLFGYIDPQSERLVKVPNIKLFALEGLPGAGKTSIINHFKAYEAIKTVPQILPHEPTFDQSMKQLFYLNSEELKTTECLSQSSPVCLLDRYYVSTLAFYWAYDQIHATKTYAQAFTWYEHALKAHKIVKPFTIFYISVPIPLSFKRKERVASKGYDNLWLNTEFLGLLSQYYDYFYREIEPQTHVVRLAGTEPLQTLIDEIWSTISGNR